MGKIVRLSVPIDEDINEKLKKLMPWGVKAQVVRELLKLLISAQAESDEYIMQAVLEGKAKLTIQNLNDSTK